MSYLRNFIPWIAFSVLSIVGWQWGAATGLVLSLFLLLQDRRAGVAANAQILDVGTVIYFAGLSVVAFAVPHSPLEGYDGALSSAWLALIAWTGLVVRQPFTLSIARRRIAEQFWNTPKFRHVNMVITTVWAVSFTVTAAAATFDAVDAAMIIKICCQILGFGFPAYITHRYSQQLRARRDAAVGQLRVTADLHVSR